jgi:acyl-coenzyme A synthetase/AMP-(fatty) acid ligase
MLDGTRISYADLIARAGQMANVLVASGVKVGDRVAAQTEKSVPALVLYLAPCARRGVSAAQHRLYAERLEYFIGDAEPSLVVCDPPRRWHRRDCGAKSAGRDAGRRRQGIADGSRRLGRRGLRDGARGQ